MISRFSPWASWEAEEILCRWTGAAGHNFWDAKSFGHPVVRKNLGAGSAERVWNWPRKKRPETRHGDQKVAQENFAAISPSEAGKARLIVSHWYTQDRAASTRRQSGQEMGRQLTFCFLSISSMRWRLAAREGSLERFVLTSGFAILKYLSKPRAKQVSWRGRINGDSDRS